MPDSVEGHMLIAAEVVCVCVFKGTMTMGETGGAEFLVEALRAADLAVVAQKTPTHFQQLTEPRPKEAVSASKVANLG